MPRVGWGGRRPGAGRKPGTRNRPKAEIEAQGDGAHRLKWKPQQQQPTPQEHGGRRPAAGRKPHYLKVGMSPIPPPFQFPVYLSRSELLELLKQARAARERDWLMILVAAWHGLSATELCSFTKDAVTEGQLTIRRIKGVKTTKQPLVRHENPLLDERSALIDFAQTTPPDQPVFNISRYTFWRILDQYGKAAAIPKHKRTPRALKHSIAIQTLVPNAAPESPKTGNAAGNGTKPKTRGPVKKEVFAKAAEMYASLPLHSRSWPNVAKRVIPLEWKKDPIAAGARLRQGATYHCANLLPDDERKAR